MIECWGGEKRPFRPEVGFGDRYFDSPKVLTRAPYPIFLGTLWTIEYHEKYLNTPVPLVRGHTSLLQLHSLQGCNTLPFAAWFNPFKSAVTFFPQEKRSDKMYFLVSDKILNKMSLISSLSIIFFWQSLFFCRFLLDYCCTADFHAHNLGRGDIHWYQRKSLEPKHLICEGSNPLFIAIHWFVCEHCSTHVVVEYFFSQPLALHTAEVFHKVYILHNMECVSQSCSQHS